MYQVQSKKNGSASPARPGPGTGAEGEGGHLLLDNKKERKQATGARFTIYKVNKASKKKREKSSAKKERKATKTLAIVLGEYKPVLFDTFIIYCGPLVIVFFRFFCVIVQFLYILLLEIQY